VAAFAEMHGDAQTLASSRQNQTWIDSAVGSDARVVAVWVPSSLTCVSPSRWNIRAIGFWENEFFNRSIRQTFYLRSPLETLPENPLALSVRTGELTTKSGDPLSARYVATPAGVRVIGDLLAKDSQTRTALYRVRGTPRLLLPACPTGATPDGAA
jgi:hypothetical protein